MLSVSLNKTFSSFLRSILDSAKLPLWSQLFSEGDIASNQVIARSEFEVTVKLLRSECDEGCDWCIYVTVVTCADTLTSTLCIQ